MALRKMYMNQIHFHKKCKYSTSNINHSMTVLITNIFHFKNVGHKESKIKDIDKENCHYLHQHI